MMIIVYLAQGRPHYPSQTGKIPFISDIGAGTLKPLFVTGATITAIFFFLSLLSLRRGRDLPKRKDRIFDLVALLFGLLGCVGLVLLSVFDTERHPTLHVVFLLLFMLSIIVSAIFTTLEYYSLEIIFRRNFELRYSYIAKASLLVVEAGLSIGFAICAVLKEPTAGAAIEWLISFIFTFYVITFYFDLRPEAGADVEVTGVVADVPTPEA